MDDWLGLHDFIYYRTREGANFLLEDTFLESSANDIAFLVYTLSTCLTCLLYTSDAADDLLCVDLGGRRIIKKKK